MEWKTCKISDLAVIISGGTPKTTIESFWNGNIPWLSVKDFSGDSKYVYTTEKTITDEGLKHSTANLLSAQDIVISARGTVGELAMLPFPMSLNQSCFGLRARCDADFLYYLLKVKVAEFKQRANGGVFGTIIRTTFDKVKCRIPDSLECQHRIASILSAYDSLIENNTKRIRLLEKMAENLYKEWFVRFRFPGYEKAEMENGLPKGWKVERVFDIADVMYGYAFKSNHFCDNPALNPVVRIRDIQNNHTNTFTDEECEEKYLIKRNAILIGMDGLFHMCLWNGERAFLNQRVVMLNSKKVDFCNYLLFMAIHPQIKYWEQVISGTTVAHLGDKHLKRVQVIVPSTEILSKANSLIARIMGKKNILLRQNSLLARRRDLLLPRLMSGKLEVKP